MSKMDILSGSLGSMKLDPKLASDLKDSEEANVMRNIILTNMVADFAFATDRGKEVVLSPSLTRDELDFVKSHVDRYEFLNYTESFDKKTSQYVRIIRHSYDKSIIEPNTSFFELDKCSLDDITRHVNTFPNKQDPRRDFSLSNRPKYYIHPLDATEDSNSPILDMSTKPKIPSVSFFERGSIVEQNSAGLLRNINIGRVIFVKGSSGCGKSTMLPHILLQEASNESKNVRVIATSPRDLSVVARARYLAFIRGETLGATVGYHVRLERSVSPCNTIMTFCSSYVLLKTITNQGSYVKFFENITHVIIDDINERDRHTDLLLVCLRDVIQLFPQLKIIILGTDFDEEPLLRMFSGVHYIPRVELKREFNFSRVYHLKEVLAKKEYSDLTTKLDEFDLDFNGNKMELSRARTIFLNAQELMRASWNGDRKGVEKFIRMIEADQIEVDFTVGNGITMVMVCVIHNWIPELKFLMKLGADVTSTANSGETALTFAEKAGKLEAAKIIRDIYQHVGTGEHNHLFNVKKVRELEAKVNTNFTFDFLVKILMQNPLSSVLVFLSSYEDIINLRNLLATSSLRPFINVFIVHPKMQLADYEILFKCTRKRRVILSTEFGENHLPIPFETNIVIDVGKNREKVYDHESSTYEIKDCWISSAGAQSRSSKAGTWGPGVTYRLYTEETFIRMNEYPIPEIQRIALESTILLARSLAYEKSIERFFERLPSPPTIEALTTATRILQQMDALDERRCLTPLGVKLMEFPLEPHLAKALLLSTVLKCVDPVLTIVAALSDEDFFIVPHDEMERKTALSIKELFSQGSYSDLASLVSAFQAIENSRTHLNTVERSYCLRNFISAPMFEIVYSIRNKLFASLRASGYIRSKSAEHLKEVNTYSSNWGLVKGVLAAAFYPKVAPISPTGRILDFAGNSLHVNQHSVLATTSMRDMVLNKHNCWVLYEEQIKTRFTNEIRNSTMIAPSTVAVFCGNYLKDEMLPDPMTGRFKLSLSNGTKFLGGQNEMQIVSLFREKVFHLIKNWIENPWHYLSQEELDVFNTLNTFLSWEDKRRGLANICGLNSWPLFVSGETLTSVLENIVSPGDLVDDTRERYFVVKVSSLEDLCEAFMSNAWIPSEEFKNNVFPVMTKNSKAFLFFWDELGEKLYGFAQIGKILDEGTIRVTWLSKKPVYPNLRAYAKEWIAFCADGTELDALTGQFMARLFLKTERREKVADGFGPQPLTIYKTY